jgi:hypothetical protein
MRLDIAVHDSFGMAEIEGLFRNKGEEGGLVDGKKRKRGRD